MCKYSLPLVLKAKRLIEHQLPRHSSYHLLLHQCGPTQSHILRQHLPDRMGLCCRYRFRDHHLRLYIRWSFQSSHHNLLRRLAGFPLEKSSLLYILPDLWSIHGRNVAHGHVLVRVQGWCFLIKSVLESQNGLRESSGLYAAGILFHTVNIWLEDPMLTPIIA